MPQLTEKSSPRPEPPSSCLDLSDVDLDLKDNGSGFQPPGRGQPVMVYDASEPVADSPNSCEMTLSVGVEASPARVVCHTPSRLDKVRNSPHPVLSPLAVTVNMSPAERHSANLKADRLSRTLFPEGEDDVKTEEEEDEEIQFKKTSNDPGMHISHQSRGIIEEILAHEMGDANIEVISLHSQSCSPHAQKSSTGHLSSSAFSLSTGSQNKGLDATSNLKPTQKSADEFDNASTVSDGCSLDEYVKPVKVLENKKSENSSSFKNADPVIKLPSAGLEPSTRIKQKKKGGRQVASRYMQSALSRKTNVTNNSQNNSKSSSSGANSTLTPTKQKNASVKKADLAVKPAKNAQKKESTVASHSRSKTARGGALKTGSTIRPTGGQTQRSGMNSSESPQPLSVRGEAVGGGSGNEVNKASTPVGDQTFALSYIDASEIQSATNMFANATNLPFDSMMEETLLADVCSKGGKASKHPAATAGRGAGDGDEGRPVTQADLDFAYARYLQWQFLLGRAQQAFRNQQDQACAQLNSLWQLTQERCQEVAQLEMDVARLRNMTVLDEVLDKTGPELTPLVANLPAVSSDFGQMATALDGTRHQLPVTDIYLPPGGDPAREAMEERMTATLTKAERILSEINAAGNRDDQDLQLQQHISQYVACLASLEKTSCATIGEMDLCQKGLEEARALNTQLASLRIQDTQSTS